MEITVNLDSLDLDTVIGEAVAFDEDGREHSVGGRTLGDSVIEMVADRLFKAASHEDRYGLSKRVAEIRDEEIRARIAPLVTEALTKGIVLTNSYGEPTGKTTTLNELIVKEANAFLTRSADDYGRRGVRVIDKIVAEGIDEAIRAELSAVLSDEKAKVVAAVRAKAAELIAEAVKQGIGR